MANNVWEKLNNKRRLKKILNKRIATYEKAKANVQMNRSINKAEADALLIHYDSHISALNTIKRENKLDLVKAFPSEDGGDIIRDYNNFLSRNREMVMQNNMDGGRIERNAANPNDVQHIRAQDYYPQEVINRYAQSRPPLNPVEIERQRAMERNVQAAGNRSSIAIPPRGASRFHDESGRPLAAGNNAGRPEQRISTVEPNVMDNNANTDIYDSTQNYYRSSVINRYAQSRPPLNPVEIERQRAMERNIQAAGNRSSIAIPPRGASRFHDESGRPLAAGNRSPDTNPPRVDSLRYDINGRPLRGNNISRDALIESSSGNSQNSGYFSSDISNNRGSNTSTYSQKSSERNSASGSSQLVKNDSYEHTNNRINQRRRNQ